LYGCSNTTTEDRDRSARQGLGVVVERVDEISFAWARSFHGLVTFKIMHDRGAWVIKTFLHTDEALAALGEDPVQESWQHVEPISEATYQELANILLSESVLSTALASQQHGADGSVWTVRGVSGNFHFSVSYWAPLRDDSNPIGQLGL